MSNQAANANYCPSCWPSNNNVSIVLCVKYYYVQVYITITFCTYNTPYYAMCEQKWANIHDLMLLLLSWCYAQVLFCTFGNSLTQQWWPAGGGDICRSASTCTSNFFATCADQFVSICCTYVFVCVCLCYSSVWICRNVHTRRSQRRCTNKHHIPFSGVTLWRTIETWCDTP